jgi:protein-S-isoprenylcysteine O-methyltransferase Ste14
VLRDPLSHLVVGSWLAFEIYLLIAKRIREKGAQVADQRSLPLIWVAIAAGVAAGWGIATLVPPTIPLPMQRTGLCLIAVGTVLRWRAVRTLGRFFTVRVALQEGQRLVREGLYRKIRHPAYSGLSLAVAGLGLTFGNWLSAALLILPFLAALLYRIRVEEEALVARFGDEYREYQRKTKRLIPGIF